MRIEFTNPWALVLLALIPLVVYFARHSLATLSRRRGQVSLAARALLLLLVVLALAGLRVRASSRDVAVLFVVDVSASVAPESRAGVLDAINGEINRAGPRDYVGVIAFGREPSVELAPTRKETLGDWRIKEIASNPPRDYTDIASALRLAAALIPEDATGRLVLISDGNENLESATDEAQLMRASGVEVFTHAIVEGKPKTVYLYGNPKPSPAILRVLAEGNFTADVRPAAMVPTTLAGFQDYDLVIFDNVPASAMTTAQMKMLQSYVRDLGGGFVMIGGDQSFGPGGYYQTPVEESLPVSLDVRQKKHFPALAIALVIDKSGSMIGSKIGMAQEAASATVDFLSERDSVGVIAFDSEAYSVVNL